MKTPSALIDRSHRGRNPSRSRLFAAFPRMAATLATLILVWGSGCTVEEGPPKSAAGGGSASGASAVIRIDGSSTVLPITQAVAEEFEKSHAPTKVEVGSSGTSGGFKKFIQGEIDINDASRPISASEKDACAKAGIEFLELPVAIDGLSVVVSTENDWCSCMTVAQLKQLWEPGSTVRLWSELNPEWPKEPIKLYGADSDSGTFDYFTEAICGKAKASRTDYTPSADDNVLIRGVAGDKYSLAYFGYAYYAQNSDKLKIVGIKAGDDAECVEPTNETIESGKYTPLSRPLFLYVNKKTLARPEMQEFLRYYLSDGQKFVSETKYVNSAAATLAESRQALDAAIGGK